MAQSHRSPIDSFPPDTDRSVGKIPVARCGCAMITGLLNQALRWERLGMKDHHVH